MRPRSSKRQNSNGLAREGRRTIVLGAGLLARQVIRAIKNHGNGDYELLGAISEPGGAADDDRVGCEILGPSGQLEKILSDFDPDRVIVAIADGKMEILERLLLFLLHSNITVISAADVYEDLTGKVPIDALTPDHFVFDNEVRPRLWPVSVNRLISLILAVLGAVAMFPLMVGIAIAVRLDSHGPALFVQDRAGMNGRRFRLLKFRTMRLDTAERSVWAAENADRITRVGVFLRKFRLDELPQLFNVLKGDMNLVGPRPHPSPSRELVELISRNVAECGVAMPYYTMRSVVRPGITGWAQVRYKYANGLCEELEKLRYDLYYVKHYSIWLDLRILFLTLAVIVRGAGKGDSEERRAPEPMGISPPPAVLLPLAKRHEDGPSKIVPDGAQARTLLSLEGDRQSGARR